MSEPVGRDDETAFYRISRFWRALFIAAALACLGVSLVFLFLSMGGNILFSALGAAFLCVPLYLFRYLRRFRIRLNPEKITVSHAFRDKSVSLSEVSGYRLQTNGYVPVVLLYTGNPPVRALSLDLAVEGREDLLKALAERFPDLDEKANAEDLSDILQDGNLGITGEDRLESLKRMRRAARAVNALGVVLGLLGLFRPRPYGLVTALLAAYPFAALAAVPLSRGLIRFDVRQKDIRPSILTAVLMPIVALMLRALLDFNVLSWDRFWTPFAFLTVLLMAAFLAAHKGIRLNPGAVAAALFFFALYGFGSALTLNALKTEDPPEVYSARVLDKRVSSGKTTSYFLKLSPWGPRNGEKDVRVARRVYEKYGPGDEVRVYVLEGLLGIRWFEVP